MSYIVKEVIAQRDGNCKPYNRLSHDVVTWDVDCAFVWKPGMHKSSAQVPLNRADGG